MPDLTVDLAEAQRIADALQFACRLPDRTPDFTGCGGPAAEAYWEYFTPGRITSLLAALKTAAGRDVAVKCSQHRCLVMLGTKEGSIVHKLKTWIPYFDAVVSGAKPFEVRRDDRGFQRGDRVLLVEVSRPEDGLLPTGEEAMYEITYVLTGGQFGIEPGYVVLGLGVDTGKDVAE